MKRKLRIVFIVIGVLSVLGVAAICVAVRSYSFEARFERSKPSLEAYAAQTMASDPLMAFVPPPRRLGDFETYDGERLPHGFLFFCDYGHPFDKNGIAFSTEPLPPQIGERDFFRHIEGYWYTIWRN